jgi:hypothetical protein
MAMYLRSLHFLILLYVSNIPLAFAQDENQFIYNGFKQAKLHLDGTAAIHSNGLLQLTNISSQQVGHAFYQFPIKFNTTSPTLTSSLSFSTNFVFAIVPKAQNPGGHGIAFTIGPSTDFTGRGLANGYLGLFNASNNGHPENHILAIELDTVVNSAGSILRRLRRSPKAPEKRRPQKIHLLRPNYCPIKHLKKKKNVV